MKRILFLTTYASPYRVRFFDELGKTAQVTVLYSRPCADVSHRDAKWFEPILRTVDMDDYSSLQYFQRVLQNSGIIEKLEEMGIQEGDTVNILGFEFDYVK